MCIHAPEKVSKTSSNTLINGTQTGLCLGGGLGIHPRGVLRQLLFWLLYVYIINIHTLPHAHTHTILTFFILCCVRLLFILFSMLKMCYFVHAAAASFWRFLDVSFFFVRIQNTKPSPIRNHPIVSNSNEWIGEQIMHVHTILMWKCKINVKYIHKP